ncbi:23S rRNA pseudouridine(2605) synthase RluB [Photobacterium sp. 1_MG-2023]|uniref:23S rRNA pseudouridine(2605) synthase RluB n=1 Tax=Photobacterium sp. 1_MG-2023 TaxID=3062646 RepID=UPI0026E24261|nr:23S rRNA pseudouridine(2605) synthase RluB [Photobacterium sp. 1_MG-2023]MDO6706558.1 23S rRNA pseudouridine(2605) synthase RluB [Photobacterium sp. 1_MG-2023]
MSEKLQKVLARSGQGSRREVEMMIQEGRVSIDGRKAQLGDRLENLDVLIRIDGHKVDLVKPSEEVCRVLAYNKPEGELCTRHDPEGRRTVFDRLPRLKEGRWVSVGRLDANTSGLLLFTTDGELANRLMHPSRSVEREYMVRVFGEVTEKMVRNLVNGVELEDGMARFEDVVYAGGEGMNHTFYVVITEGRNREVRRLWDSQGVTVSRLKRVRYGDIFLTKDLPRGGWMELELQEVNYLREVVELPAESRTHLTVEGQKRKKGARKIRRAIRRHEERVTDDSRGGRRRSSTRGQQAEATERPASPKRKPSGNAANRRNPLKNKPAKPRTRSK